MKIKTVDFCRKLRDKVHEELKDKTFEDQKDILAQGIKEAGMDSNVIYDISASQIPSNNFKGTPAARR